MINSHYVPQQTLKRFSKRISIFNVRTGEFRENVKPENAYAELGFYSEEVEHKLNKRIESQFGNLFANTIMKAENTIAIKRDKLRLIKKFLLISVIRSMGNEEFMQIERKYYDILKQKWIVFGKQQGLTDEEIEARQIKPPFEEKIIEGETPFDYWMRTLNVILDTDGTPQEIFKHQNKTYPAYRWSNIINDGYLAFWDSEYDNDEFLITDIGMTSENEIGWNESRQTNAKKLNFLLKLLNNEKDQYYQQFIINTINKCQNFHENFMMFPISAKRMIVEISPFYKFRIEWQNLYKMPSLKDLTFITNENLYYPNTCNYVTPPNGLSYNYHPNDLYIYKIKKLTKEETRYCNELFLDRINTWLGFSSLEKVAGSLLAYKQDNSFPFIPRIDYTKLYEVIKERNFCNIDINSIRGFLR